jgi:Fur family peroxide stress response transcriptional regulator
MTNDRANEFAQALKDAGLRLTHPRLAMCRVLATDESHPTATQLHARLHTEFPSLSLATVYSTLNTLASLGLVFELGNAGDGHKHYDPDTAPHANLICTRCHRIRDLDDTALEAVSTRVAKKSGYQIQGARIVYYGVCPACSKRRNR